MNTTLSVSEFKAHALATFESVAVQHVSFVVTKRGKPIARVIPYGQVPKTGKAGRLAHLLVEEADLVSPLGAEMWSATK